MKGVIQKKALNVSTSISKTVVADTTQIEIVKKRSIIRRLGIGICKRMSKGNFVSEQSLKSILESRRLSSELIVDNLFNEDIRENFDVKLSEVELAIDHMRAWRVGYEINKFLDPQSPCPCCCRNSKKHQFDLFCDLEELTILGLGYPLLFQSIQLITIIMSVLLLTYGVPNLIMNLQNYVQYCSSGKNPDREICINDSFAFKTSKGSQLKDSYHLELDNIFALVGIIILIVVFQVYRKKFREKIIYYDDNVITPQDYTIEVLDLAQDFQLENSDKITNEIKNFFENILEDQKIQVKNINFCFRLAEMRLLEKDMIKQKKQVYQQSKLSDINPDKFQGQKIKAIQNYLQKNSQLIDMEVKFKQVNERDFFKENFTGRCYVSFQYQRERDAVLEYFKQQTSDLCRFFQKIQQKNIVFQNQKIRILLAPDPSEIEWYNIQYPYIKLIFRRFFGLMFTVLVISIGPTVYFFIEYSRDNQISESDSFNTFYQTGISLFLFFLNELISFLLDKLCRSMKFSRTTDSNIFFAKILALSTFLNSTISLIINKIFLESKNEAKRKFFEKNGLVDQLENLLIVNVIMSFITEMINFRYLRQAILRVIYSRYKRIYKPQKQLNEKFENPEFILSKAYAKMYRAAYLVCFFSSILPMALIISIVGYLFFYWYMKYNLLRKSTIQQGTGAEISIQMIEMMQYCLPIYSLGNVLFEFLIIQVSFLSQLGLGIGLLHAFLPMQLLNEILFKLDSCNAYSINYAAARDQFFITDYNTENPATSRITIETDLKLFLNEQQQIQLILNEKQKYKIKIDPNQLNEENIEQDSNQRSQISEQNEILLPNCSSIGGILSRSFNDSKLGNQEISIIERYQKENDKEISEPNL